MTEIEAKNGDTLEHGSQAAEWAYDTWREEMNLYSFAAFLQDGPDGLSPKMYAEMYDERINEAVRSKYGFEVLDVYTFHGRIVVTDADKFIQSFLAQ